MSDATLKDVLKEIEGLSKRMDHVEWLLIDSKIEEVEIISEYEKDKAQGKIEFKPHY